ncbi:hypothetical protein DPMN_161055 [Dreissena polymorpha]|uniref:Uncharacterized protein n=1 Tax=Dreissena polymorpha TaxID=45954 RepID=A0A9D4ISA7_DREPO|nr:hypothetical protein DPMN_161055 [Dreissena polymorpha]
MYSIQKNKNKDFKELAQLLKPGLQMPHGADTACTQRSAIQWRNRYSCENMLGRLTAAAFFYGIHTDYRHIK